MKATKLHLSGAVNLSEKVGPIHIPPTVSTLMLAIDRYLDFHFYTNDLGENMIGYANLFGLFGHPEVYLIVTARLRVFS